MNDSLVGRVFFLGHDFDSFKMRLQSRAFDLCRLLRRFAFREQDQSVMASEIRQRFRDTVHDVRWRIFEFRNKLLDPLNHFALRRVSRQFHIRIFERAAETAHTVAVLANVALFRLIQDVPRVFARVAKRLEPRNELVNRLLEENIVFPERVVGVYEKRLDVYKRQTRRGFANLWK